MPTWRNSPSMPKVRASSGTIGTTSWPRSLSRSTFASIAEAVTLDGAGEDDGRRPLVLDRGFVGVVDLVRVVPAKRQLFQLVVRQVLDHIEQARVGAPEMLAHVCARFDGVLLILAV